MPVGVMATESSVLQAIRGRLADKPVLDLHPLRAVLAFETSIDGLLCLSNPLAKTRHATPKHIAGHQHTAVRAPTSTDSLVLRPRSRELCNRLLTDVCPALSCR